MTAGPLPPDGGTGELRKLLAEHAVGAFAGCDTACTCDRRWRTNIAYREHLAEVVTAYADRVSRERAAADGATLIAAERRRQVEAEGWTSEHDAEHYGEALAVAACCYAVPPQMRRYRNVSEPIADEVGVTAVPTLWPWRARYWKPTPDDRVRELVKAGALIAAEIDRLSADALAADDRTDPLAGLGEVARQAVADASPRGPLTGGLITPENPVGGLRPADDRTEDRA